MLPQLQIINTLLLNIYATIINKIYNLTSIQYNSLFPPSMEIWQTLIHGTKHKIQYFKQYMYIH